MRRCSSECHRAARVTERAAPMYCPYCGEDVIRPFGDDPDSGHADWRCEACLRVFSIRYKGLTGAGPGPAPDPLTR